MKNHLRNSIYVASISSEDYNGYRYNREHLSDILLGNAMLALWLALAAKAINVYKYDLKKYFRNSVRLAHVSYLVKTSVKKKNVDKCHEFSLLKKF